MSNIQPQFRLNWEEIRVVDSKIWYGLVVLGNPFVLVDRTAVGESCFVMCNSVVLVNGYTSAIEAEDAFIKYLIETSRAQRQSSNDFCDFVYAIPDKAKTIPLMQLKANFIQWMRNAKDSFQSLLDSIPR